MNILFAPARIELLTDYGSEVSWCFKLIELLARDPSNHLTVVCNTSNWDPPGNVRLVALGIPNANSDYGRLRFLIACGRIAGKLQGRGSYEIIHHMFPFGFYEGIDFYASMFSDSKVPLIIGPIQHPQEFVDEQDYAVLNPRAGGLPHELVGAARGLPPVPGLLKKLHRRSFSKARALVFDGARTRDLFSRVYSDLRVSAMQAAIPPGVETDLFSPGTTTSEPVHDVMSAGFLIRRKGYGILIRGFSKVLEKVPDARLRIYGEGPAEPELRGLCRRSGVADSVCFEGRVPRRTLASSYRQAAVYVQPSLAETFPSAVREAMACGKPIVATDTGLMGEYLSHGESGLLVPVGDEESLADAILEVLANSSLAGRLGRAARLAAETQFSWDVVFPKWLDLYSSLV